MPETLTGHQRAAAYLKGLPSQDAAAILARLSPDDRSALLAAVDAVDLSSDECQRLVHTEEARRHRHFCILEDLPAEALAAFLQQQHPQLSATLLRELSPASRDAAIEALLPGPRRDVVQRLRGTKRPDEDVLRLLDNALRAGQAPV